MSSRTTTPNPLLSPRFFEAILNGLPGLIFVKDVDLRFVYVNTAFSTLFRRDPTSLIGLTDADIIDNAEQVRHFRNIDRQTLLEQKPQVIREEFLTCPGNEIRTLATKKVPLRFEGSDFVLGMATDISDIRHQRSEEIDGLRATIIGDLAHVIRSPVATAVQNLLAMRHQILAYRSKRTFFGIRRAKIDVAMFLRNIEFTQQHLAALTINSRNFAAIAQSLYGAPTPGNEEKRLLEGLIRETMHDVQKLIGKETFQLTFTSECSSATILLDLRDVSLVKTAIFNIVHNAYKFTSAEHPVEVALRREGQCAVLTVRDKGCGIPPGDLSRVFEAGFSRRATGHGAGTGMGLTIAKGICDRLNWPISIKSAPTDGTTVTIRIFIQE